MYIYIYIHIHTIYTHKPSQRRLRAGCGWGNGFVGLLRMPCFRGWPCFPQNDGSRWIFAVFLVHAKSYNSVIYSVFVS